MENNKKVRFIRVNGRVIPITESQHKKIEQHKKEKKVVRSTRMNAYMAFSAGSMYGQYNTLKRNFNFSGKVKDKTFRMTPKPKKPKPKGYNWGPDKAIPKQQIRIGKAPRRMNMNFRINSGKGLMRSLAVAGAASGVLGSMYNKQLIEDEKGFSGKKLATGVGSAAAAGYVGLVQGVSGTLDGLARATRSPSLGKYAARWSTKGGNLLGLGSAAAGAAAYKAINERRKRKSKQ